MKEETDPNIERTPFTSEELIEFEDLVINSNNVRVRNIAWRFPAGKCIRFLHFLVRRNEMIKIMKEIYCERI